MKWLIRWRNYIILFFIVFLIFSLFFLNKKEKPYIESFDFKNKTITIIIYDKINRNLINDKIKSIYSYYEKNSIVFKKVLKDEINKDVLESSYVTEKVINYLKKSKINKFLINENGNIVVGRRYNKNKYNLSINNPNNGDILKVVNIENKSMATSTGGGKYDSIVIISDDYLTAVTISNYLNNFDIEKGKKIAKKYNSEVLWYYNDNIITTEKFSKYFV